MRLRRPKLARQMGDHKWRQGLIDMVRYQQSHWPIGSAGPWYYRLYHCNTTNQYWKITEREQHGHFEIRECVVFM